jgi:hypothetical protein
MPQGQGYGNPHPPAAQKSAWERAKEFLFGSEELKKAAKRVTPAKRKSRQVASDKAMAALKAAAQASKKHNEMQKAKKKADEAGFKVLREQ